MHGTKAQWYATEFEKLRLGVEAYPNKIDLAIGDAEAGLDEQIKVVKKKISDVELKIAEQNAFVSDLCTCPRRANNKLRRRSAGAN